MIFPADQARRIERGDRTTIRVPVDPRLTVTPLRPVRRNATKPFLPNIEELLRIAQPCKREDPNGGPVRDGWEIVCRVRIVNIDRGPLGELTDEQAQGEGYETAGEFVQAWVARHHREWFERQFTQLVEEDIEADEAREAQEYAATIRYRDVCALREVWTLTVRVEHDTSQFLNFAGSPTGDYTVGADPLEAGVVPAVEVDQRWARRAVRCQLEALAENASPEERSRRARALGRRVRALALQDPTLARRIEDLVKDAEREAA